MSRGFSRLRGHPDLLSGLALVLVGAAIIWMAQAYQMGTPRRMGPAFLPTLVGGILAVFGLIILSGARKRAEELPDLMMRPVVLILVAIAFWALTIEYLGLVPSTFGLVIISAVASPGFGLIRALLTAGAATLFAYLVFIAGLGMPIPVLGRLG
jgi:hypothetical protein